MHSLNVEDNTEDLRYDKVILATDADVDGMHIRNLMITCFFKFFEQLVHDGHVYVLEAPLFRARTGKSGSHQEKTIYCYSENERDNAIKELGGKPEITRFKGLGEISPKEFAQFIGKVLAHGHRRNTRHAPSPGRSSPSTWVRTRPSGRTTSWTNSLCRCRSEHAFRPGLAVAAWID